MRERQPDPDEEEKLAAMARAKKRQPGSRVTFGRDEAQFGQVPGEVIDHHGGDRAAAGEIDCRDARAALIRPRLPGPRC
jgi:hypothetical protein